MGRGRYDKREHQLGKYWLGQRPESPAWYRCWSEGGRTRRVSLGTTDRAEAEARLTDWYIQHVRPTSQALDGITIAEVIKVYLAEHAATIRTGDRQGYLAGFWLAHFGTATIAEATTPRAMQGFMQMLKGRGYALNTVRLILSVGRAAINRAWKMGEIASAPHVPDPRKRTPDNPRGRPLEVHELRTLLAAAPNSHLREFILWGLGTGARPEAILQLHARQIDRARGLVQLNPAGREQTTKFRPEVKLPPSLAERAPVDGYVVNYRSGVPVGSIKESWRAARAKAGLGKDVNPYSLRHTAARWMMMEGVPLQGVAFQLGHKVHAFDMTHRYIGVSPEYLREACAALDRLVTAVLAPEPHQPKQQPIRPSSFIP